VHSIYTFNFLETISEQLKHGLESMPATSLNAQTLAALRAFQREQGRPQGVYLLHYRDQPAYVGKANDVAERLEQHLEKLIGRRGIDLPAVGYKALLLDSSMGTAASEDVLIRMFKQNNVGMWNGQGFGPKDPGQNRDNTEPGFFDRTFPIIADYPISGLSDDETLGTVLTEMKRQLPYLFRFRVGPTERAMHISLLGVSRDAESLLRHIVRSLGAGWHGAVISYGMVLYPGVKDYPFGRVYTGTTN
jgi:hypothetical protein